MGLEVAFTRNIVAWPLAGRDALWFEATDLDLTSPGGSRQFPARDMPEISPLPDASTELAVTPAESLAQPPASNGTWSAAIIFSCLLHAGVAAAFLISPKGKLESSNTEQLEGSDQSGDKVVGSALDKDPAAINVTIEPPSPEPAKAAGPVPPKQPSEPTREPTAQLPAPAPEPAKQPDILVTKAPHPDDQSVVASTKVEEVQPANQVEKTEMSVAVPDQPPIPSARPTPPAPPATARGADARSGTVDGQNRLAEAASKGKRQKEAGSAETEFNYRSDVIRKLSRVNRAVPPSVQLTALNNAVVTFMIGSHGGIDDLRILQSSGSPNFDQVVLGIVRKAAPFPPIPPQVASESLVFEVGIGPF